MAKKKLDYDTAYAELQEIISAIQQEEIGLEDLIEKLKRGAYLINFCKERLRNVEAELDELLGEQD